MISGPLIFDRRLLRIRRDRAAADFDNFDFLVRAATERLVDRLLDLRRDFGTVVDLGGRTGLLTTLWPASTGRRFLVHADLSPAMAKRSAVRGLALACDEEAQPFSEQSLDAVISCLSMHWVNDLPGALAQIHRSLRPDGLFLASILGGDTLSELREVMIVAEQETTGGASPRISPFAGVPDLGALLQRAGFALPVVDSDSLTVTYPDIFRLMTELRGMGETSVLLERSRNPLPRRVLLRAAELYRQRFGDADGRITATFQILTMTGWKPHSTQQQPLRPGSARVRLATVLEAAEEPLGEAPLQPRS